MPQDTCNHLLNKHKTLSLAWLSFGTSHCRNRIAEVRGEREGGEGKEGTEVQERRVVMGKMETLPDVQHRCK